MYTVTDVLPYHEWVLENFAATKLFEKVTDEELEQDPIFKYVFDSSEEGKKVSRNEGSKYHAIYRRTAVEPQFEPDLTRKDVIPGRDNQESDDDNEESEAKEENEEESEEKQEQGEDSEEKKDE